MVLSFTSLAGTCDRFLFVSKMLFRSWPRRVTPVGISSVLPVLVHLVVATAFLCIVSFCLSWCLVRVAGRGDGQPREDSPGPISGDLRLPPSETQGGRGQWGEEFTQKLFWIETFWCFGFRVSAPRSQRTRTSPMRQATPSVPEACRRTIMYMYTLKGELFGSR